jgi:hypothetical protein
VPKPTFRIRQVPEIDDGCHVIDLHVTGGGYMEGRPTYQVVRLRVRDGKTGDLIGNAIITKENAESLIKDLQEILKLGALAMNPNGGN